MLAQPERPIRFSSRAKFVTVLSIVVITVYLLSKVFHILLPFIWAIIFAYIFNPLVSAFQRRTKLPRFWGVLVVYVMGFGLIFWVSSVLIPLLTQQISDFNTTIPTWVENAREFTSKQQTFSLFGYELINFRDLETKVLDYLGSLAFTLPESISGLVFGLIEGFILTLVFLVVTFYLLLQADDIVARFYNLIPSHHRTEIRQLGTSIDHVLSAYIRGQFLLIIIMSVLSFIALSILQVRFALIIAIATGILEIIPIVGPYLAGGIACLVALLQGTTPFGWEPWTLVVVLAFVYFALRMFEDHFIIPNLVGHIVNVHPVFVIFAILAGGALAGGLGLLIGIPIAAVTKIILVYLYSKLVDAPNPTDAVETEENHLLTKNPELATETGLQAAAEQIKDDGQAQNPA